MNSIDNINVNDIKKEESYALEMKGITKVFGSLVANKDVDLNLKKGEILSILGENGSGKTTLMNMLSGIYYPDAGKIYVDGKEVTIKSPIDAYNYHIGMVHQHFKLVDLLSGTDNIILGEKYTSVGKESFFKKIFNKAKFNILRRDRTKIIKQSVDKYGFDIDLNKKVYEMSVSEKQTLEIIKVLYKGAEILILDEPTAVLTPQEIRKLFEVIRKMKADGKSVIIITHKLNEVMAISDRVAILRKGQHIATVETAKTTEKKLTEMMVGRKVDLNIKRKDPINPKPRLEIKGLTIAGKDKLNAITDATFNINGGEILGIAGISGNGQKELLEGIAGLQNIRSGEIVFHNPKENKPVTFFHKDIKQIRELAAKNFFHYPDGTPVVLKGKTNKEVTQLVNGEQILFYEDEIINLRDRTPRQIQELGIKLSFVPEDRLHMGLVGNMSIVDNMLLRSYRKGKSIFLNRRRPKKLADDIIKDLEVVTPSDMTPVRRLSGGNVQKVLVGREISSSPKVLMAAYPVRGLDINSSYLIYDLLNEQKSKNVAVVFVGEDLDVLLALCDRILVLCAGRISGIVDAKSTTKEELGLLMTKIGGDDNNDETEAQDAHIEKN